MAYRRIVNPAALLILACMLALGGGGYRGGASAYAFAASRMSGRQPDGSTFDTSCALEHIERLAEGIGERPAGSEGESAAASYIEDALSASGYGDIVEQPFPSVDDHTSRNIYVEDPGTQPQWVVIVGAHYDTADGTGSPGANDNASGVGVMLELARVFREVDNVPTLVFAAFASEEIPEGYDEDEVGYGSDYMAGHLRELGGEVIGMVNLDMVGVGDTMLAIATLDAPGTLVYLFTVLAGLIDVPVVPGREPGWSDNAVFEDQGVPALWLYWAEDLNYHTPEDSVDKIEPELISASGELLQGFLAGLTADVCALLGRET